MSYTKPEAPPMPGVAQPTWDGVIARIRDQASRSPLPDVAHVWGLLVADGIERDIFGTKKHGVRHQHDNGRDHAVDAYQEALDGLCYAYAEGERAGWTMDTRRLFRLALDLTHGWRAYLYARDGR